MKSIQKIYTIIALAFAWNATALIGDTFPQTNALVAEIKIAPPEIVVGGQFGQFVAAKSDIFVASYKNAAIVGTNTPIAAVFRKTDLGLEQEATLSVPAESNLSLQDLATDGNQIALFGVEGDTSAIYVFGRQQEQWGLETKLLPSETIRSISLSDGVIVAGAAFKALVFEFKNGAWIEKTVLPPEYIPTVVKNGFGAAAVVNDGTIIIAAVGEIRSDPGRAYVYVNDGEVWVLQAELRPEDYTYVRFGLALAIDGETALISSYPDHSNNCIVYLFQRSAGAWARIAALSPMGPQEFFGRSVAVSGRNLVVGAPSARGGSGGAYLFRRNGSSFDRLILSRDDTFHDPLGFGDSLGHDVAVGGNALFFSAPYHDAFAEEGGVAFLFNFEFTPMLESVWARPADNSFHFNIADTKPGQIYKIETTPSLGAEWTTVKQLTADHPTTQVEVDIPAGDMGFFRVSNATTKQQARP